MSNVATGAVPRLDEHPLPALLQLGVPVVLGSDDPPMFATSLLEEYGRARDVLRLDRDQLIALAEAESRPATPRPRPRTGSGQRRADRAELD